MKQFKYYWQVSMLALTLFLALPSNAGTHYVGSYVLEGNGQDVFIDDCNKFRAQFTATVGSHTYYNNQYYYGYRYLFEGSNDSYIDYQDLAFVDGHGAPYFFSAFGGGTSFYNTGNGWGNSYLKWAGIFTCSTIMTPDKDAAAWTAYNNTAKGVHMLCGFNESVALAYTQFAGCWAAYMKQGNYVWYAWFRAANAARNYYGSAFTAGWPGKATAVMFTDQYGNPAKDPYYDTLSSYSARPTAGAYVNFLRQY
jgi:Family of unknown function (DUF6345)